MRDSDGSALFALVTAAHHFLLTRGSPAGMPEFLAAIETSPLPKPLLEAVLLRTLAILDRRTPGGRPTAVERYLRLTATTPDPLTAFRQCGLDLSPRAEIRQALVRRAVAELESAYADSKLTVVTVAQRLKVSSSHLCRVFHAATGSTVMNQLRSVRLDRAAVQLLTTTDPVKDIWTGVGYNHASNFNHDFKDRFGINPHEFRVTATWPRCADIGLTGPATPVERSREKPRTNRRVLVIDDDAVTRDTFARYLGLEGFTVEVAPSGEDALQLLDRPVDVILLDCHLPGIDGLECLRSIRRHRPGGPPAVFLFTADWSFEDHAAEVGVLDATILSKLTDIEDVVAIIGSSCAPSGRA